MTRRRSHIIESAADSTRSTGPSAQELTSVVESDKPEAIAPAHLAAIAEGIAQLERGEHAPDASIRDTFRRAGL